MRFFLTIIAVVIMVSCALVVRADEYDDIGKKLSELQRSLELSQKATSTNVVELTKLNVQLQAIKTQVINLESAIAQKEKEVKDGEEALAYQKGLLDQRAVSYYKSLNKSSFGVVEILISADIARSLEHFFYQKTVQDEDRRIITKVVLYITDLEDKKTSLQNQRARLSTIKEQVDKQSQFMASEVAKSKAYEAQLQNQIATLSARQQEIVNSRSGTFIANIGNSEEADDYNASINGFRESAPGGYFAVFAFGAHTHRKGMSQYGARGRAQSGQDYKAILRAYYGKDPVSKDTGGDISVAGHGSINFEEKYLYGIAEMPSSWHPEALKAQAVAARTYAYRYKTEGKEICTTEACQVYSQSKADNPPDAWKNAVNGTRGQVLEDVVTYYASTHGVFTTTMGWDTTDGSGGGNFVDKSYEKLGGSPWVYKAWYTKEYSTNSDKCGRSNPWLNPTEMADIVNAAMVMNRGGSGADTGRVTPVTTGCWGGNPYSHDELKSVSQSYGGGVGSVSGVSVSQGNGTTNEVVFQTDAGEKKLSGTEFKKGFNLRAPGYLSIPQYQFAFFNVEKK